MKHTVNFLKNMQANEGFIHHCRKVVIIVNSTAPFNTFRLG